MSEHDIPPDGITDVESWLKARLGRCTASRIGDATRQLKKGGWGADRENYKMELIAERLTGQSKQRYISEAMVWGQQVERDALLAYQARTGNVVDTSMWFAPHPTIEWSGASPDALVGTDGMVQIKAPETSTFVKALLTKAIDPDHHAQVQWEMACTGRKWSDLILFDPRINDPRYRMIRWRIERDDLWIANAEEMVRAFLKEIEDALATVNAEVALEPLPVIEPEAVTGWSDNVPQEQFSSIESLIAAGLVKKGM